MAKVLQAALFDVAPKVGRIPCRVQLGDLWQVGRHRLLCGDSTAAGAVALLTDGAKVADVLADPPYGIAYNGDHSRFTAKPSEWWWRTEQHHLIHTKRAAVMNDTTPFDSTPWLAYKRVCLWGAQHYAAALPAGSWLVWDKRHANGKALLSDGDMAWLNKGRGVYIFSHVWQGLIRAEPEPHLRPTQKPVRLMMWCLERMKAGTSVLDPYCGSGPTILACERTGRTCYAMEIDPRHCDKVLWRWQREGGALPILLNRQAA